MGLGGRLFRFFELLDQRRHLVDLGLHPQQLKGLSGGAEDLQGARRVGFGEEETVELANEGDAVSAADPEIDVPGFGEPF